MVEHNLELHFNMDGFEEDNSDERECAEAVEKRHGKRGKQEDSYGK